MRASLVGVIAWLLFAFVSETSARGHDETHHKRRHRRRKLEDGDTCNEAASNPCGLGLMCWCSGRRLFGAPAASDPTCHCQPAPSPAPPLPPPSPPPPASPPPQPPPACQWASCAVEVLNLGGVDANLKGFVGGFATSNHAYYVPASNGGAGKSGYTARVALSDFTTSGVEVLNLASVDSNLKGFHGGFATSTHAYYVPYHNGAVYNGYAARVSLSDFTASGVEVLNLASADSNLKGFFGGFATSTHAYYVPHYGDGHKGHAARVSLSI